MPRHVVCYEGKHVFPGVFLERNAVVVKKERYPVIINFEAGEIVGVAKDFQRNEETGELSFDVRFRDEGLAMILKDAEFSCTTRIIIESRVGDDRHINEAELMSVHAVITGANPRFTSGAPVSSHI